MNMSEADPALYLFWQPSGEIVSAFHILCLSILLHYLCLSVPA